jgi:hypothetical protein
MARSSLSISYKTSSRSSARQLPLERLLSRFGLALAKLAFITGTGDIGG